jgi:hypothetical protein
VEVSLEGDAASMGVAGGAEATTGRGAGGAGTADEADADDELELVAPRVGLDDELELVAPGVVAAKAARRRCGISGAPTSSKAARTRAACGVAGRPRAARRCAGALRRAVTG